VEDQNGNFEMNEINSGEGEKNQNIFKLDPNREYKATFSFIDDESNRIFIHLEKFTENLQQIEVCFPTGVTFLLRNSFLLRNIFQALRKRYHAIIIFIT